MGYLYILAFFSFLILIVINLIWLFSNLYFATADGFETILRGQSSVESIYFSVYLRWIILADITWIVIGIAFMIKRRKFKTEPDIHFLQYKKFINPSICMVIPTYNESKVIGDTIKKFLDIESVKNILVIDNNSSDNTVDIAKKMGAKVIEKDKNKGFGHSVAAGLKEALSMDENIIGITEADGTSNSYDISKMLPYLDNCDMVIGSRQNQVLTEKGNQNRVLHVWGNFWLAKLIQIKYFSLLHTGVVNLTDVGCVFRLISKKSLEKIIEDLFYENTDKPKAGIAAAIHLTMLGIEHDLKITEIPITFNKRIGESKLGTKNTKKALTTGLYFLWFIIKS